MRKLFTLLLSIISVHIAHAQFQFISPKPGSTKLPLQHNIIIREGSLLNPVSMDSSLFTIQGSKSGNHFFNLVLCDDGKTIDLNPTIPFTYDETVSVSILSGLTTMNGEAVPSYLFSFTTARQLSGSAAGNSVRADSILQGIESNQWHIDDDSSANPRSVTGLFTILTNNNPSPGNIFFDSRPQGLSLITENSLNVIDNNGDSIFQKNYSSVIYDFQMGGNGYFDTYRTDLGHFDVMDSNFNSINSFSVTNGFKSDQHELTMLPNGYSFLTGIEDQPINDTSDAVTEGSVIQEFDPDHNIIFEWRSFDRVDEEESPHLDQKAIVLDCIHTNSIDVDTDGNIIVSQRNLDQINKIDVNTGEFIWRLGGVKNEFTFINDTAKFTAQHDCRRIANGDITLYDDGNYHSPPRSYAKEYRLDEVNKTATLVWSYTHPDVNGVIPFYAAMGSVQRLPSGNTFIDWGQRTKTILPSMTEVDSSGNIVWELTLNTDNKLIAYRAHKYLWNPCARPSSDSLKENQISDQSEILYWLPVANHSQQYEVQYKIHDDSLWIDKKVNDGSCNAIINNLIPEEKYDWRVRSWCDTTVLTASSFTDVKTFATVESNSDNPLFSLFPNPASDEMLIDCNCHINHIRVMNLLGQEINDVSFNSNASTQLIEVSVSNLPSGNYLVEITSTQKREVKELAIVRQ